MDMAGQAIMEAVIDTISRKKGRLIIPAFALGRTQEIVFLLNKLDLHGLIPDVKIYVDSPLSTSATEIIRNHISCLDDEIQRFIQERPDPFGFDDVHYIQDIDDSKRLNEFDHPFIVISASGMAEAGRVKHHIRNAIDDQKNTILIVGYASPQSLAGQLRNGEKFVKIFGEEHEVKAEIKVIDGLSAHGDYEEMLRYLSCIDPKKVKKTILVHGEMESQLKWKERLFDKGFRNIFIPKMHEMIEL
jgi:metallo-beta-lactamase family protein